MRFASTHLGFKSQDKGNRVAKGEKYLLGGMVILPATEMLGFRERNATLTQGCMQPRNSPNSI